MKPEINQETGEIVVSPFFKKTTWSTYVPHPGLNTTETSLTQPDEVLSVRDMLIRHARGLPLSGHSPVYDNDYDDFEGYVPDPRTLDLVERQQLARDLEEKVKTLKEKLASEESASKEKQEKVQQAIDSLLNSDPPSPTPDN